MCSRQSARDITAMELIRRIEAREEVHILDVRAPDRLRTGRIDIIPGERFHNVRGSEVLQQDDPGRIGLPSDAPIAVVCGYGNDSRVVSAHLNARGFDSSSLSGGMAAWMGVTVPRQLDPPPGCDRLVQFDRVGKGALGYVVVSDGEALVIDPPRHTHAYIEEIERMGATVTGVADTHAHADYISGGSRLARDIGCPYYLHPNDALYPYDGRLGNVEFEAAGEGRTIRVGRAEVKVFHTPGHTEGSVCYLIGDHTAFTGDFLFVESVGRPDLGGKAAEWTQVLWRSLERIRREWPEGIHVYPGHYSTDSERNADRSVGKTLRELSESNSPLAIDDRDRFTEWVSRRTGTFPDAYRRMKGINLGLEIPSETDMDELEAGRNQCALE